MTPGTTTAGQPLPRPTGIMASSEAEALFVVYFPSPFFICNDLFGLTDIYAQRTPRWMA